jgi:hypothetical protein
VVCSVDRFIDHDQEGVSGWGVGRVSYTTTMLRCIPLLIDGRLHSSTSIHILTLTLRLEGVGEMEWYGMQGNNGTH